ncbi:MAG: zinc transporter ZupT [Kiritimatiellia bacterium]
MFDNVVIAFALTLFAGMATGIGSLIAFWAKRTNYRFLSIATGFSAGVMLYVSFVEIFFKGAEVLTATYGDKLGNWINVISFFGGMLVIGIIDTLVPAGENPHETPTEAETRPLHDPNAPLPAGDRKAHLEKILDLKDESSGTPYAHRKLMRMGIFTALAIAIHNFPEGLVTFLTALEDPSLGAAIAIALALHNIPEGISVSVPIFYATGNRKKAFLYSFLSGLAEPLGAMIGYGILLLFFRETGIPPEVMGILFAGVAGVMVYISLDELLPTSRAYGKGHDSLIGLVGGMVIMALSLLLMS